ncbi:enolase C-terminal domain-like protein [Fodinicola feengrottensis]|uniref:enolase C-terminal domain-like protein n=1 Tax=Fodinicola feengrottensis TaxID=435914 RepID=UPI0024419C09|nr:enolase C-terminal domain-like protein [Fodinicola feengrottensis]
MKFGWGGFGMDPGLDRENLAAIRDALPAGHQLMVDPGWYVDDGGRPRTRTADQIRTMLSILSDFQPYWVEDFVHPEDFGQYRSFKAEFPGLRFAAGEQQATIWDFRRLLTESDIDVLQPDLSRCGGLTVALALRAETDREIVTHSWLTDLLHAYSLHFLATLPSVTWVEFNVAQSELSRGACSSRLALEPDGTVAVRPESGSASRSTRISYDQS